jgi:hypothetical protein
MTEEAALRDMGDVESLAERLAVVHQPPLPWRWYLGAALLAISVLALLPLSMVRVSMGQRLLAVPAVFFYWAVGLAALAPR